MRDASPAIPELADAVNAAAKDLVSEARISCPELAREKRLLRKKLGADFRRALSSELKLREGRPPKEIIDKAEQMHLQGVPWKKIYRVVGFDLSGDARYMATKRLRDAVLARERRARKPREKGDR